ncbi:hypothetical protein MY3296_006031 [Beauveria thailandica]
MYLYNSRVQTRTTEKLNKIKYLIIAAVACASLTADATAAASTDVVAARRITIEDVFEGDDNDKRNFCGEIIGSNALDVSAQNAKLPGWSAASISVVRTTR